jgi:hypothetical protein
MLFRWLRRVVPRWTPSWPLPPRTAGARLLTATRRTHRHRRVRGALPGATAALLLGPVAMISLGPPIDQVPAAARAVALIAADLAGHPQPGGPVVGVLRAAWDQLHSGGPAAEG